MNTQTEGTHQVNKQHLTAFLEDRGVDAILSDYHDDISRGRTGYVALYRFVIGRNEVRILAIRHLRSPEGKVRPKPIFETLPRERRRRYQLRIWGLPEIVWVKMA